MGCMSSFPGSMSWAEAPPLGDQHAVGVPLSDFDLGGDGVRLVLEVGGHALGEGAGVGGQVVEHPVHPGANWGVRIIRE